MAQNRINNTSSSLKVDNLFLDGNTVSSTDTNGNVILAPDGSGVVSVTTAPIVPSGDRADSLGSATNSWDNVYCDGLTFDDGTNVLSTFVDVTAWTPTIVGISAAGAGTYSIQVGRYSRVGNLVFLTWSLTWSAHTGTGNIGIGGLPIAPSNNVSREVGTVQYASNTALPANTKWGQVVMAGNVSSTYAYLQFTDTTGSTIQMPMDTAASCKGSMCYFV